jgi:hypothetical protein
MPTTTVAPVRTGRSTAAEIDARVDAAADLLADGATPAEAVDAVATMYALSTRQAQRIVRRARARVAIESASTLTAAIDCGLIRDMAERVGDGIGEALAEGDRRGAAALLGKWSDLVLRAHSTVAPADAWDRSLAAAATRDLPASLPF